MKPTDRWKQLLHERLDEAVTVLGTAKPSTRWPKRPAAAETTPPGHLLAARVGPWTGSPDPALDAHLAELNDLIIRLG